MYGSRSSKYSDIAFISEYNCDEWLGEGCDFVGSDIEVVGSSEYVIGDRDYFDREIFYVPEFECPKCKERSTDIELKVG
jgi:hypothetical protein